MFKLQILSLWILTMSKNIRTSFYAVGKGRTTGIFNNWPECEKQIRGIQNAKYKKFASLKEAEDFVSYWKHHVSPHKGIGPTKLPVVEPNVSLPATYNSQLQHAHTGRGLSDRNIRTRNKRDSWHIDHTVRKDTNILVVNHDDDVIILGHINVKKELTDSPPMKQTDYDFLPLDSTSTYVPPPHLYDSKYYNFKSYTFLRKKRKAHQYKTLSLSELQGVFKSLPAIKSIQYKSTFQPKNPNNEISHGANPRVLPIKVVDNTEINECVMPQCQNPTVMNSPHTHFNIQKPPNVFVPPPFYLYPSPPIGSYCMPSIAVSASPSDISKGQEGSTLPPPLNESVRNPSASESEPKVIHNELVVSECNAADSPTNETDHVEKETMKKSKKHKLLKTKKKKIKTSEKKEHNMKIGNDDNQVASVKKKKCKTEKIEFSPQSENKPLKKKFKEEKELLSLLNNDSKKFSVKNKNILSNLILLLLSKLTNDEINMQMVPELLSQLKKEEHPESGSSSKHNQSREMSNVPVEGNTSVDVMALKLRLDAFEKRFDTSLKEMGAMAAEMEYLKNEMKQINETLSEHFSRLGSNDKVTDSTASTSSRSFSHLSAGLQSVLTSASQPVAIAGHSRSMSTSSREEKKKKEKSGSKKRSRNGSPSEESEPSPKMPSMESDLPDTTSIKAEKKDFLPFIVDAEDFVNVFTDGSCFGNGRSSAKAGIGIWFGEEHPLNVARPVDGPATNNTAEIQAARVAVELATAAGLKKLRINTDSEFLISCMTDWINKWKRNNWTLSSGGSVKNREELEKLDNAMSSIEVAWNKVPAHSGVPGNEMADKLANEGARQYIR